MPIDKIFQPFEETGHGQTIKNLHCHETKVVHKMRIKVKCTLVQAVRTIGGVDV